MAAIRLYCARIHDRNPQRYERDPIEMAHDFENKNVGKVAMIIAVAVLTVGILGILVNLS